MAAAMRWAVPSSRVGTGEAEICASVGRPGSDCTDCGFGLGAGAAAWANAALASAGASSRTSPTTAAERPDVVHAFNGLEIKGLEIKGLEKSTRSSRMRKLPLNRGSRTRHDHGLRDPSASAKIQERLR